MLIGITDETDCPTGSTNMGCEAGEVTGAEHRCLIDDQDIAVERMIFAPAQDRAERVHVFQRGHELLNTFNCGLGMVVVMAPEHVQKNLAVIEKGAHAARVVGEVISRGDGAAVRYRGELKL